MFVAKYPQWLAAIVYKDNHAHYFDGAKDMFKYLLSFPKYAPGHKQEDIAVIAVSEYYDLRRVNAMEAVYVIGSDVTGPMGHELVPFASREDAEEFIQDHKGRIVLSGDVSLEMLAKLDRGVF
jgi:nitrous oxide reductase accessory protein NosL